MVGAWRARNGLMAGGGGVGAWRSLCGHRRARGWRVSAAVVAWRVHEGVNYFLEGVTPL